MVQSPTAQDSQDRQAEADLIRLLTGKQ